MNLAEAREFDRGQLDYGECFNPPPDQELRIFYERGWRHAAHQDFLDGYEHTEEEKKVNKKVKPWARFFVERNFNG